MGGGSQFVPRIRLAFLCIFQTRGAAFSRGNSTGLGRRRLFTAPCYGVETLLGFTINFPWCCLLDLQLSTLCFVCVASVCVCLNVCLLTHICVGVVARGQYPGILLYLALSFYHSFFEIGSLMEPGSHQLRETT